MVVHPPTTFSRPGNAGHYNTAGIDVSWQSESPGTLSLRNWRPDGSIRLTAARKRAITDLMASRFGGSWHFTPGYGCPGQFGADGLTPAQIVTVTNALDATVVAYLYGDHDLTRVPAEFGECPVYRNKGGYYADRIR